MKFFNKFRKMSVVTKQNLFGQEKPVVLLSNTDRWWLSFFIGLLFALFASPFVLGLLNIFLSYPLYISPITKEGGITYAGLVIQTILFILVVRLLLQYI